MEDMFRKIGYVITVLLLVFPIPVSAHQWRVVRVTDGDTIIAAVDGIEIIVHLVGIDAPEKSRKKNAPGQPFSQKSTKHLVSLVLNKTVDIKDFGISCC